MKYIHGLDLNNFLPCWNLSLGGRIWSPNYLAKIEPGIGAQHKPIDAFSIQDLRVKGAQIGAITPRSMNLLVKAPIIRSGQRIVDGNSNEVLISEGEQKRILEQSDAELRFEEVRRDKFSNKVSRLSCLWIAERNDDGIQHLKKMFEVLGPHLYIVEVQLSAILNLTKADTSWYDKYCDEGNDAFINHYWAGEASTGTPTWEYLLDGELTIENASQLDHIKEHGTLHP